ncbi:hypothetical protein HMPREF9701_01222 [Delftia acidovorans CCUG 274B]|uniref:hypothetical protein n=1 Tax=Delftia TaxID=80865 RepID=UPI00035387E8|nr:hypothetical protein [Delftia acidovorans]EPD42971.1 hypothetical protein HMPREF9701_01222 [Delftia acidovorans CCUG 274B]
MIQDAHDIDVQSADQAKTPRAPWWLRGWIPWLLCAIGLLAIAALVASVLIRLAPAQVLELMDWFRNASRLGAIGQTLVCIWVIARWRRVVAWGRRRGFVSKAEHCEILLMRWRAAGFLALYLIALPIGPGNLARAVLGWFN